MIEASDPVEPSTVVQPLLDPDPLLDPTGSSPGAPGLALHRDFAAFYAREIRAVVGLAYVLSGSRTAAEDLAQDAFVAAYRHWPRLRSYDDAGAWVRRVAVNRSISLARRRIAEAKALLRLAGERTVIPDLSPDHEDLWAAVRRLPRRQAQVVALHYWDRRSTQEIAVILEVSSPTPSPSTGPSSNHRCSPTARCGSRA
jgi:RNA polymerase sigma factor (sigma-70 family)